MAAGVFLIEEAGGLITGYDNSKFSIYKPPMAASNGHIHSQMLEILR
jgi:myo-inositol-1(or 4)-monophosphatase